MNIGIIVATNQEIEETKKILHEVSEIQYYNLIFYKGIFNENDIVLVKGGVGKVNAARTTQILIDKFNIEKIINIGAAGGINPDLNIKDIVIGEKLVQYDFDLSALDNTKKGEINDIGMYIESDKDLINKFKEALLKEKDFKYKIGIIASGDTFYNNVEETKIIREEFGAECVEMEGAAVAQVCYLSQIPFVVIKGISDVQNKNNAIDYYEYCNEAANQAANLLKEIL